MASTALLGFTKGFFDDRNRMIDAEQERRNKLTSALQALQMEGMKERVDLYNKEKKMWAEVNANLESDPTMAMATYAKANGLQDYWKELGKEKEWTGNVTQTKEALRQAYDKWQSMPAPEFDTSEIEKVQMRRAIDDDAIGGFIRKAFGVEPKNTVYTPKKGLAKMSDTEVEALAQAMYTEKADTTAPTPSTTTPISSLFTEKANDGDDYRMATIPIENPDGSKGAQLVPYKFSKNGEPVFGPITTFGKSPATVETGLSPTERAAITAYALTDKQNLLDSEDEVDNLIAKGIGTAKESGPIQPLIVERVMSKRSKDSSLETLEAYHQVMAEIKEAAPYALRTKPTMFGYDKEPTGWQRTFLIRAPNGQEREVAWYEVGKALSRGGVVVEQGN